MEKRLWNLELIAIMVIDSFIKSKTTELIAIMRIQLFFNIQKNRING